jgi:hypothetical protein
MKKLILFSLLVTSVITNYAADQKVQQLKEARFQKELELSDLGAKIAEKEDLLRSIYLKADEFVAELIQEKKMEGQEKEAFLKELNAFYDNFGEIIDKKLATRTDVKQWLVQELLKGKNRSFEDFETLKLHVIRNILERNLLKTLLEHYEACLQELIEIDRELDLLKKI